MRTASRFPFSKVPHHDISCFLFFAYVVFSERITVMRHVILCLALLPLCFSAVSAQVRPVHTFSIVARDSVTGQMGVAVQSHWFSVGPLVPWAEAGVGAVATQSFVDPAYGPLGLQ